MMEQKNNSNPYVDEHYMPKQYSKDLLMISYGTGSYLYDNKGKRYLDFGSGIAVNALGYGREDIAAIAYEQMKKVIHVSNLYTTEPAVILSAKLTALGNFGAVHFGNSGSEANEAAIKYARLYAKRTSKIGGKYKIGCFTNAFHGRTMGALSCTPKDKYREPFVPLMPGVEVLPYNDAEAVKDTLDSSFAGVIVEVLQGEGGLDHISGDFAAALREQCDKHDIILIADEVQTGCGRTGEFFASSWAGLNPDIITLSKPLAAGLPLSATLIPDKINDLLTIGDHGTTFGGGPVTTAVASFVLDQIFLPSFLDSVKQKGELLAKKLEGLVVKYDAATAVKGKGLLRGLVVQPAELIPKIMKSCADAGLLVLRSGADVLRITPPLIVTEAELEEGVNIIDQCMESIEKGEDA